MTPRSFGTQLTIISVGVALLLLLMHQWPSIGQYQTFSWICWSFYVVFSAIMFLMAKWSAWDANGKLFISTSIMLMGGKMLFSVLIVILYSKIAQPTSRSFVLPFFLVYVTFTIFETYFMMKLAEEKRPSNA